MRLKRVCRFCKHTFKIYLPWFLLFGFAIYHYDAVTSAKQAGLDMYQKMVFQEMATMKGYADLEGLETSPGRPESPKFSQTPNNGLNITNYQDQCNVHRHIAFLKTHKTGR